MSWQVDYAHTHIQFSARHMMISTVRGQFEKFKIDAHIDDDEVNQIHEKNMLTEDDIVNSRLEVRIDAASLDTHQQDRDKHLRSADFFDVERFPYITFKAKRGKKVDEEHGKLIGELTIRDVTREVTLDVEYLGQARSPWGTINAGFTGHARIRRKDWGLSWNVALETGGWLVGEDVNIDIEIEFTKVPAVVPASAEAIPA